MTLTPTTLEGPLAAYREQEIQLLNDVADTLAALDDTGSQDDRRRLRDVAKDLGEMFFLVAVIGEFNAGKSTFINAMLGEEVLPMGITPTTEAIELIRYAETPMRKPKVTENGKLREWAHPNTGAPGVAIVDTPGTGSIFEKHDVIAKDFLHRSDMVIFLVSAKRAFADTERMYLELAQNYGKKTILVLNQIDLMEGNELQQVRKFVERQVKETLGFEPLIFPVSSKLALKGEGGGIEGVRAHLRGVFAEAPPAKQKLLAQLDLADRIIKQYLAKIDTEVASVQKDTVRVKNVQEELEKHSLGLDVQFKEASAEIETVFEALRQRGHTFIDTNMSVRQIVSRPNRAKLQADFQDQVIGQSLKDINGATNGYINAVIDSSRVYWRGVIDRLSQLKELMDQELGGLDASVYAEQRESLEEAIRLAKAELQSYSTGGVVGDMREVFESNLNAFATSTFAALMGVAAAIAAAAANGPLIGAGAAAWALPVFIVAAPVALFGGAAAVRYYNRVQRDTHADLDQRVDKLVKSYHASLNDLTGRERQRLKQYGNQVLTPIFNRLDVLQSRFGEQRLDLEKHQKTIQQLHEDIQKAVQVTPPVVEPTPEPEAT
jgi:small GTP-binding protein